MTRVSGGQNGPDKGFAPTRSKTLLEATASHSHSPASAADGNRFRGAEGLPNLSQSAATSAYQKTPPKSQVLKTIFDAKLPLKPVDFTRTSALLKAT